jgi:ATP-dependent exoDNAse (exonuclease V) beta subunit
MGKGTLTIYSASAGSGKTYALTEIYLISLFRSRYSYRRILAVTFTNKATAEMKSRILDNLDRLATGQRSDHLSAVMNATGKSEEWIRKESGEILNTILHDFSRFSISTIDSFFQKIVRAFAREVGLHSGFNVELDHSIILSSAVDEMIKSAAAGTQLNRWLMRYAMTNLEEERSWNLKNGILKLSEELFKEKFKILSSDDRSNLENKDFLMGYIENIKSLADSFEKRLTELGRSAEKLFSEYNLTDDMFFQKGRGIPGFIRTLSSGSVKEPNNYVREIEKVPPKWSSKEPVPQLQQAIAGGLEEIIVAILRFHDGNIKDYKTANVIFSNIYALGILSDVLRNIHILTTEENSFLLSDAGEIISLITAEDQAPFIYEKAGNRYENFMIDEFQDTSIIQWKNLWPLIENSMSEGFDNLVVGDIKQSIYRWRNSDWRILGSFLGNMVDNDRYLSKPLVQNFRSRSNIITFNNALFTILPSLLDQLFEEDKNHISFSKIYSEAVQSDPGKNTGGYVRIEFIENQQDLKWYDAVLERLPSVIESLQDKGYMASDIGIIVRDGREGASVLKTLIDYHSACSGEKKGRYNYNVVSSDSLLLSSSPAINFIISVISSVNDPSDMISRALMLRLYLLATERPDAGEVSLESGKMAETSRVHFPDGYEAFMARLKQLPLFEATESIIGFFGLGELMSNVPYLNTFQDYVVAFTGSRSGDMQAFLEWWDTTGSTKSVVLPGNQNALRILTIHKSKGLQFKVVILPFLSWDLDHKPSKQPFLWVKPEEKPFSDLGVVPVKYGAELLKTGFSESYLEEKHSVYVDNINLLYVAFTRAIDIIYGFSSDNPKSAGSIAGILKSAVISGYKDTNKDVTDISRFFNSGTDIFELGEIPARDTEISEKEEGFKGLYRVTHSMESLKLKLHGENYFSAEEKATRERINYGKLMHEVFEGIKTASDISGSVRRLVIEGKLPESESSDLEKRIEDLVSSPKVREWFSPGSKVLTEAGILLLSGISRRPDRVILMNGKTIIIDFKFGDESSRYIEQMDQYRTLLMDMGYANIESFIWYVDRNLIVRT